MNHYLSNNHIYLWLYKITQKADFITEDEIACSQNFTHNRLIEYRSSRNALRKSLSEIYSVKPSSIKISAKPGESPFLLEKNDFISISHTKGVVLIGWSKNRIGIDIEINSAKRNTSKVFKKIFSEYEIQKMQLRYKKSFNKLFLEGWTAKESAIKWLRIKENNKINDWQWNYSNNSIFNIPRKINLDIFKLQYKEFIISVSYKSKFSRSSIMLCSEL